MEENKTQENTAGASLKFIEPLKYSTNPFVLWLGMFLPMPIHYVEQSTISTFGGYGWGFTFAVNKYWPVGWMILIPSVLISYLLNN